jgi:nucleotide-binding universal stress UspA family protein
MVASLAAELAGPHYGVSTQVTVGDPLSILTGLARQADLLVIGSHRRPGFERFLLGSISHALLHASPCSVLLVR